MKFRVTLRLRYMFADCPGRSDPSARDGHYFEADCWEAALGKARMHFPGERFTVQDWSFGHDHGVVLHDEGMGASCPEMSRIEAMLRLFDRQNAHEANEHLSTEQVAQVEEHLRHAAASLVRAFEPISDKIRELRQRRDAEDAVVVRRPAV